MDPGSALVTSRRSLRRQRGNALLVALIALTGLATLGSLTVVSMQGGQTAAISERSHVVAVYAAESGAAVAMDFLRNLSFSQYNWFSNNIRALNQFPETPSAIPGNEILPGVAGNVFDPAMRAWYRVTLFNNVTDPNFDGALTTDPIDSDGRVLIRSTGFGPEGATATIEVEVQGLPLPPPPPLPPPTAPRTIYTPQNLDGLIVLGWREVP